MKYFSWNTDNNKKLQNDRNISFEEVVFYIQKGQLLDIVEHPNQERYFGQKMFIININDYAYLIPFVETEKEVFLKTIIPSRKATKNYLGDK